MSHPFAYKRDDGFGLVDVRVVTGIVQRHEGGVGIVRQQGLLVFFRFKGLVIDQNPSTNGFTPTSFRRFGAVATRPSAPRNGSGCLGTSKSAP